ncbi:MAG TPA: MFS transporter [Candidatus Limnocylindria bacterium]|nr:MFS transporter [Candidatus Limnocylindria bacterium]
MIDEPPSISTALKNTRKLYILTALTNLWFFTGNWLYFYRLYMSDRQIGILDGVVFGIGLIAEIPSGALADLLGRKNLLRAGLLLMSSGFLAQGFAHQYLHLLIGLLLFNIGVAMVSGSDDALVYDSLDAEGKSDRWKLVIARKHQIMLTVTIASYLAGGLLYAMHFRLPFIMAGLGILIAFFVASTLKEVTTVREKLSMSTYVRQNVDGMRHLLKRTMWLYAFMAVVILGCGFAFDVGVVKPLVLDTFGFRENAQAVINTVAGIASVLALSQINRLRKLLGEKRGLTVLALGMGIGFLVSSFPIGVYGVLAFLAIVIINSLVEPWLNDIVQHQVPSSHRATALSTLALLQKLPYVLLAPLAGILSSDGNLSVFLAGISLSIFLAIVVLLLFGFLAKNVRRRA